MKKTIQFFMILAGAAIFASCGENNSQKAIANAKTDFGIEGMTCDAGCAKTIEATLNKLPGVSDCKVNFTGKRALVKFDSTQTSADHIIATLEQLNNGQYKVALVK